jgi:hypothetical protein
MTPPHGRKRRTPEVLYSRKLPGGGYVTILTEPTENANYRGWISVERRSDRTRRDAIAIPVIAETLADSTASVLDTLKHIASDNVAIAKEIRRWETRNSGD